MQSLNPETSKKYFNSPLLPIGIASYHVNSRIFDKKKNTFEQNERMPNIEKKILVRKNLIVIF
jgi:hypothetical protein